MTNDATLVRELIQKLGWRRITITVSVFFLLFSLLLVAYWNEGRKQRFVAGKLNAPAGVVAHAKIVSADTVRGVMQMRIEFETDPSLLLPNRTLANDMTLFVDSGGDTFKKDYRIGEVMSAIDVTVSLHDGDPMIYPFDSHIAHLEMYLARGKGAAKPQPGKAAADDIPLDIELTAALHGFRVRQVVEREESKNTVLFDSVDIYIARTPIVIGISLFLCAMMWGITGVTVLMSLGTIYLGRKIEMSMISFMAGMLFVFPAMRNLQPGVPPLGSLTDVLCTFWVQSIMAACLIAVVRVWLKRAA